MLPSVSAEDAAAKFPEVRNDERHDCDVRVNIGTIQRIIFLIFPAARTTRMNREVCRDLQPPEAKKIIEQKSLLRGECNSSFCAGEEGAKTHAGGPTNRGAAR